ncbi:MAG: IS1634 family transposase [Fusobacteria bacterium]|nr:IS1634 family transposase [Fusobacteriota bacterium]
MATLQKRKSHGQNYWYIVESRRVNGKPRPVTLAYLGKAEDLLSRLEGQKSFDVKSYSHGDTFSLCKAAEELGIIDIINKYVTLTKSGAKPVRDELTVGASLLLAAIGRSCRPTSKMGWYDWAAGTSLEISLNQSMAKLDSQHFWDQMNVISDEAIEKIESEVVKRLVDKSGIKLDSLFFDTTNFFTFIDSMNKNCDLPQRGHNKQKRFDLRQIGMALLVSKEGQIPLFHKTYKGNKNDSTTFSENFQSLTARLKSITNDIAEVTIVFDKGNNSKENFKEIDNCHELHYVAGLVSSHFKNLIQEANKNFQSMTIEGEEIPVYRVKKEIWGQERTCVVTVSQQLKEGQIQGIHQHLEKKYKALCDLKKQIESKNSRKSFSEEELTDRLKKIIRGQFIDEILKYEIIKIENQKISFTYSLDNDALDWLKNNILGRKIHTTNRHSWSNEEICLAYRGQANVEFAFRNLKNPFHMAIRPQFHWTDQKIKVHFLICIIGYLLTSYVFFKIKSVKPAEYSMNKMMEDLKTIRLTSFVEQKDGKGLPKTDYKLEKIKSEIKPIANFLSIDSKNFKIKLPLVVYK